MLDPESFLIEMKRNSNEFQVQDIRIPLEELKIFEIKCTKIPISALPAGARYPKLLTEFEKVNPSSTNICSQMAGFKSRIAGVMLPRDSQELSKIENLIQLNRNDMMLKQEFEECLKKCVCVELVQIKEFYVNNESLAENSTQVN